MPKWQKLQKQLKAQKEGSSSKSMKRMMKKMGKQGMNMNEIENVEKVVIYTIDNKIVIDNPENVTKMLLQQGEVYQIVGNGVEQTLEGREIEKETDSISEEPIEVEEVQGYKPPSGDIQLVAQQAGVTLEEAEDALIESKGNLAKAIIILKQK
ncbi:MAG: nascent polypeptide-associated complex protein [Candidatus Hodarchaeota archaeon]